ncbi:hypothetical protein MTE01_32270 [Microbacterium testaceum]|uniref:Uncharacterized protein n=1 Tax=Microbacterium testaceum TaxID=2033 RepID=A0A4Y3QQ27_MICTE|nr:hypothetical protein [Microbacterium testaceum]GEB47282.1 hypothetical protein MTE01_32270 [Microbacterium testaceum]
MTNRRANDNTQDRRAKKSVILAVVCTGVMMAAGCTPETESAGLTDPGATWQGGNITSSTAPGSSSTETRNIAQWSLPLDEFAPEFSNLDNYAEQLLLASCLSNENIKWPVPWQDIEEPTSPVFNQAGRRLFDLEIAQKYGFRTNLAPSKSSELWEAFVTYEPSEPGFQEAFDTCLEGIRKEHPVSSFDDSVLVTDLISQIQSEASLSPQVQQAADLWRSCMQPLGFGQIPASPSEFPSSELLTELGSAPPFKTIEPSAREVEVAVAYADCLDSSGYSAALYETEWTLQSEAIERDRANLDRVRDSVESRERDVRAIIAANAPRA